MNKFAIAIHGGAGTILRSQMTSEKEQAYLKALATSIDTGYKILQNAGSALDAAEAAVRFLEDCTLFNAGKGSVYTSDGNHEMDAAIMDGSNLEAGAVAAVQQVRNPISLARLVMDRSSHVLLVGNGALEFARINDCRLESAEYFFDAYRYQQWLNAKGDNKVQLDHSFETESKLDKYGTVGAVALDIHGNLAAATSTGGMTNKKFGRVGDSPIIGAGTYANNKTCAVSCTGHGEFFMKNVVAFDVSCLMEYKDMSLQEACNHVIHCDLPELGGEGGVIAVDKAGNISLTFNSSGMYRASRSSSHDRFTGIYS